MTQGMRLGNDIWLALIFPPAELEPQSIHLVYGTAPLLLHIYFCPLRLCRYCLRVDIAAAWTVGVAVAIGVWVLWAAA